MTINLSVVTIIGLLLLLVGLGVFLGGTIASIFRVSRQYSSAMIGNRGLRVGAALGAAGKLWPFALMAMVGATLLVVLR